MTNKNISLKPAHRTRLRSRSKSSNSEDLKSDKSAGEAFPNKIADAGIRPKRESASVKRSGSKSPAKTDDESLLEKDSEENQESNATDEDKSQPLTNSEEPMEVDHVPEKEAPESETVATPVDDDDDDNDSCDFAGFDEPEDKYLAFSVVLS